MIATSPTPRFVRRTALRPDEYRKNFHQIDRDVIAAVTSQEADRVTPLMSKIYLRLAAAPAPFWEGDGVLYFGPGAADDGRPVKASKVLYALLGVASATAHKALAWMHGRGVIGYFAGKNGVGIRIFLNRAANSIGARRGAAGEKIAREKILPFARGSGGAVGGSAGEPAFRDSSADREAPDTGEDPGAPQDGAGDHPQLKSLPGPTRTSLPDSPHATGAGGRGHPQAALRVEVPVDEIVSRLRRELEPSINSAASRAAAREHERMREWMESKGLPKAARVAQREAYNVLRTYGVIREGTGNSPAKASVGRNGCIPPGPHTLSGAEVEELAHACVAMLEAQGQSTERTLSEMSLEAGGFLLPEDVVKVREYLEALGRGGGKGAGPCR